MDSFDGWIDYYGCPAEGQCDSSLDKVSPGRVILFVAMSCLALMVAVTGLASFPWSNFKEKK